MMGVRSITVCDPITVGNRVERLRGGRIVTRCRGDETDLCDAWISSGNANDRLRTRRNWRPGDVLLQGNCGFGG